MNKLGHERYFVHGSSEVGSEIGSAMAVIKPKAVMGLHVSDPYFEFEPNWMHSIWIKLLSPFISLKVIFQDQFEILNRGRGQCLWYQVLS